MPIDTLGEDAQDALKGAEDFLRSNQGDKSLRQFHLRNLQTVGRRLTSDVEERSTTYLTELHSKEKSAIDEVWAKLNSNSRFIRTITEQKADQQTFDDLRRLNGGAFPKNISPVLYHNTIITGRHCGVVRKLRHVRSNIYPSFCNSGKTTVFALARSDTRWSSTREKFLFFLKQTAR
jgi:hypothetical protein